MIRNVLKILILSALWASTGQAQVAVIANKSVPVDGIKKAELLDFYTGDIRKWDNQTPVIVFDLKQKSEMKEAFYDYLGKSPSRMKSLWLKRMLSGEGEPPQALESEEEMLKKVAETTGAIGFVSKSKVNGEVKVLVVIEKGAQK
jgi:ABC-type phosphate transport system substrate-binding protein